MMMTSLLQLRRRTMILSLVIAFSSTGVAAYIPSVHSHDHALVTIPKPTITTKTTTSTMTPTDVLTTEAPSTTTIAPSNHLASSSSFVVKVSRTKWGTDHEHPEEYWFDNRIHTLGNHGFGGAVHAALAPFSTKIIDLAAYHGVDVRLKVKVLLHVILIVFSYGAVVPSYLIIFSYFDMTYIAGPRIVRFGWTAKGTSCRSMLWCWYFDTCTATSIPGCRNRHWHWYFQRNGTSMQALLEHTNGWHSHHTTSLSRVLST